MSFNCLKAIRLKPLKLRGSRSQKEAITQQRQSQAEAASAIAMKHMCIYIVYLQRLYEDTKDVQNDKTL